MSAGARAVEQAAAVLAATTWPDGGYDGMPSGKVALVLAEALAAAGLLASPAEVGLRAAVEALAEEWEAKHADHIAAAVTADSELIAALQVASGSVRKLCADDIRAALTAALPADPDQGGGA